MPLVAGGMTVVTGTDSVVYTVVDQVSVEGGAVEVGTTIVEKTPVPELVALPVGPVQWIVCEGPTGYGRYHDGFG
jgi:hypothetical protein